MCQLDWWNCYFWVCLRCFQERSAFESVVWVKKVTLTNVGVSSDSLRAWIKKKKGGEEGWICSFCSGRDTCLLLPLDVSRPGSQASGLGLNYTTSSPGSLACRQQIMGLLGFHNPEPIPVINLLSSISICILLVLLLWRTLIQQVINFLPRLIHLIQQ